MAEVEGALGNQVMEDDVLLTRKRFKASELPLSLSQRSVVDGILHTFKKKGEFDALRKQVWDEYSESADKTSFITSLEDLAEAEIDRDPSLLSRDRGKAATLMQGAVDRSDVYKSVELSLDRLLAEHLDHVEATFREIRRAEVGEDVASDERKRGNKTDEEYAAEAASRREAREEQKKKDEARKRREEEKEALKAEEAKKKAELEKLRRREERRKEEEAKAAKRAKDREANRAIIKKAEEEEQERRQERHERRAREEAEKKASQERSHERVQSAHREAESVPPTQDVPMPDAKQPTPPPASASPAIDEKDLEAIALERLLNEGRELAAKSGSKLDNERADSLGPPLLRGGQGARLSPPKGPASDRVHSPLKNDPPKGPRLGYSQTIKTAYSPYTPDTRRRSRSPSHNHSYRSTPRRDSASDLRRTYDSDAKAAWKKQISTGLGNEAEYHKSSATRERSHTVEAEKSYRDRDYYEADERIKDGRHQDYYAEPDKERGRYKERDSTDYDRRSGYDKDYRSSRQEQEKDYRSSRHDYEKDYRSSRHDRSRSRDKDRDKEGYRERESHSYRDREYGYDRDHKTHSSRYQEDTSHRSRHARSRSPDHHRNSYEKPYEKAHDNSQEKPPSYSDTRSRTNERPAPVDIDRYVPSTSVRSKEHRHSGEGVEEAKEKERSTREGHEYKDKPQEKDRTRDGYREREEYRDRDRDRDRDRESYKERESHRDRDRDRERESYKERDSYREPPGDRDRDRERYKERESRDKYSEKEREMHGERDKYAEKDAREKKGYVEIDRYVPGSSSRSKEADYPRSRDGERPKDQDKERPRDRDRERPREREREREREAERIR